MQRKQFLVKLSNESEGNQFIEYLTNKGFSNIHKISFNQLRVKVLVIDDQNFFSTNVTCLAAFASCGIKPISVDEFKILFEYQPNSIYNL